DLDPAVFVHLANVAGAEPAVLGERVARGVGILVIAAEDRLAAGEDLTVHVEPNLAAVDCAPDGAKAVVVGIVDAERARGLGQPVPLDHEHSEGMEELEYVDTERGRAGDAQPQASAETLAHLREHEAVGQLPPEP